MRPVERLHEGYVHGRRVRVLCEHLAEIIPRGARVLDVGCGDGLLAHLIQQKRPDIDMRGVDVLVRSGTHIPVDGFDGRVLPCDDGSLDVVMFVDVLHHTDDPMILLREATRVARQSVVIKDHTLNGFLAGPTLRFMDQVGNARHGVNLPYNYWPKQRWLHAYETLGLTIQAWLTDLQLYPWPADWIFGRSLHFIARLDVGRRPSGWAIAREPASVSTECGH